MSSGDNITDGGEPDGGDVEQETFHIYILSFAYGLMMLVVVGHLVWRWQWRRRSLSRFKSHIPGDKAFRSKNIRERLTRDFAFIKNLSPDPRLISDSCEPSMLGGCKEGSTFPSHWYRMKAFDEAAHFVSNNLSVIRDQASSNSAPSDSTPRVLALPEFLSQLREQGSLPEEPSRGPGDDAGLVERCCEVYNAARHRDGDFGESQFNEFDSLLKQLGAMMDSSTNTGSISQLRLKKGRGPGQSSAQHHLSVTEEPQRITSVGSEIIIGYGQHQHLQEQLSLEPLIATSPETSLFVSSSSSSKSTKSPSKSATAATHDTPSRLSLRRPPQLTMEMSPLITDVDLDTPTGADEGPTDVFDVGTPRGQGAAAPYTPSETPV